MSCPVCESGRRDCRFSLAAFSHLEKPLTPSCSQPREARPRCSCQTCSAARAPGDRPERRRAMPGNGTGRALSSTTAATRAPASTRRPSPIASASSRRGAGHRPAAGTERRQRLASLVKRQAVPRQTASSARSPGCGLLPRKYVTGSKPSRAIPEPTCRPPFCSTPTRGGNRARRGLAGGLPFEAVAATGLRDPRTGPTPAAAGTWRPESRN